MRRFLASLLALGALLFVLDRAIGSGMAALFRSSASEEDGDTFGRAFRAQPGIVICGSSRAMHHYVADSLGAALGIRVYNLGRDGSWGALYEYGAASMVLRHGKPRLWIMEADRDLYSGKERLDYLSCFLPYAEDEPAAAEVAILRSRWERIRMLSRIYPYNAMLVSLLAPRLGKIVHPRDGYLELTGVMSADTSAAGVAPSTPPDFSVDSLKIKYLRRTVALLKERGVRVVAVRSPTFLAGEAVRAQDRRKGEDVARVLGDLTVKYFDFNVLDHPEFAAESLYFDAEHLNGTGALRFTRALEDSIQFYLAQTTR